MAQADLVLEGGTIWCGAGLPAVEALAVAGDRVLATGTAEEMRALAGPATRRIDLKGRFAMPGLYDAHMHLLPLGVWMSHVDLRPSVVGTLDGLLAALTPEGRPATRHWRGRCVHQP
ncbi:amidohydrolase family protein [Paracoccus sanguinis]|uniref:Amidohydrolase 3 domain-containing protein n=1 Tax=Paracoccus sanguinis TaxID=1545044 RepID=A0A1H2XQ07_9RHOB|nr:amidohydrolase family protein [Paracoccus sanguinis]KGJ19253.1 hypothetical protein IX57_00730 [Paracoccus sanguinis]SDW94836.1 hypothetical protein SAMN05444276_102589 [Paracoccus sanguinis]